MARRPERGITRRGEPARMPAAGRVCGQEAGPQWCQAGVFSRGLCRPHYRRAARGLPLDPDDGHTVGVTPSGHGTWGAIATDDQGRLLCHDCGRWYINLAVHIGMTHRGGTRTYRLTHGLLMSTPLVAADLSETQRRHAIDQHAVTRLEPHRTPDSLAEADPTITSRGIRLRRTRGHH